MDTPLQEKLWAARMRATTLARCTGLSNTHVSRIVHGLRPSRASAQKIAAVLAGRIAGANADEILRDLWPDLAETAVA